MLAWYHAPLCSDPLTLITSSRPTTAPFTQCGVKHSSYFKQFVAQEKGNNRKMDRII